MSSLKRLLIIPRIQVQNANALSSPFTIGFPAMTAWLGAVHTLQRKLQQTGFAGIQFSAVGVVSHQFDLQTHRHKGDFVTSIIGTGNPLDKEGNRPSFIEEARAHLTASLIIEYTGLDADDKGRALNQINKLVQSQLKIAGGDILAFEQAYFTNTENTTDTQKVLRKLMPGYVLLERRELMQATMANGKDALEALIDYLVIHQSCSKIDEKVHWTSARKQKGWLVPIAVGFQGVSPVGQALNQRDTDTPHRFAEAVVTLGEFRMAHHITEIETLLWSYQTDLENHLYLCETRTAEMPDDLSTYF
ncbi:type I-F CRISPR-associated protein Csy2 [Glaciecola sp. SC05]|uniref:type I-F CRISPR-associated protein Csy2 n=1 Tax=Glaciecola sp. SC05 TaxID=1987355 RepID=UPI003528042D